MADTAASITVCSRMFMVFLERMAPAQSCIAATERRFEIRSADPRVLA